MEKKIALSIEGLKVRYGAIEAVKGINIEVPEGSVVALLGSNGAGKTCAAQQKCYYRYYPSVFSHFSLIPFVNLSLIF